MDVLLQTWKNTLNGSLLWSNLRLKENLGINWAYKHLRDLLKGLD